MTNSDIAQRFLVLYRFRDVRIRTKTKTELVYSCGRFDPPKGFVERPWNAALHPIDLRTLADQSKVYRNGKREIRCESIFFV